MDFTEAMNLNENMYELMPIREMIIRRFKNGYLEIITKAKINLKDIRWNV